MKKVLLFLLTCFIVYSFSTTAYSAEGSYVGVNIGAAMLSESDLTDSTVPGVVVSLESDTGVAYGIAYGYGFSNNLRIEGELAYQKNDLDKVTLMGVSLNASGDTSSLALLFNGYYDFANSSAFTPFISVGIGAAKVEANNFNIPGSGSPSFSEDDTVFAYQVGLGVGYAVSEKTSIDLKYRYFGTADPEFDTSTAEYGSHNIYVGLRFGF